MRDMRGRIAGQAATDRWSRHDRWGAMASIGFELVEHQPPERTRRLLDPNGHPCCLYAGE